MVYPLDSETQDAMAHWVVHRQRLGVGPLAPWFTVTQNDVDRPIDGGSFRGSLREKARSVGIEKRVSAEGLRLSGLNQVTGPRFTGTRLRGPQGTMAFAGIETGIEADTGTYFRRGRFSERYPHALEKWLEAETLFLQDPTGNSTRVGHDIREAMMLFARELLVTLDIAATTKAFLDALLDYFGTVWDLAQRQEHGALRDGDGLANGDGYRLVLYSMLVMYELDTALVGRSRSAVVNLLPKR